MAYKNNPLDDIVKCNIDISRPAVDDATFDTILLIVPAGTGTAKKEMKKTTAVSSADELLDYGFTVDDPAYKACTAAFSQSPCPDFIEVCICKKTDGSNYEDIKTTLTRAYSEAAFYGIALAGIGGETVIKGCTEWTEAHEKIFGFDYSDIEQFPLKNTSYLRTFAVFDGLADGYEANSQPDTNAYIALGIMAKCFGYDPGTETWHLKALSTFVPSALSTDQKNTLKTNNINSFLRYAGDNVFMNGKMIGDEWIDVIRFRDWLKNKVQVNCFNVLKLNKKVPYTNEGIALIKSAIDKTLADGQTIGGIAPDEYNDNYEKVAGYTITVPNALELTESDRKSRVLKNVKWTARLAGAIHEINIQGNLTF